MTIDLKDLLIMLLIIAAIVLVIYLIIMVAKLIPSLKNLNSVLEDVKRITTVAAGKAESLDGVIDETSEMVLGVVDAVRGNTSMINKVSSIGTGLASAKNIADKLRSDDEKDFAARARVRRSKKRKEL
ncbi:MAG: hypothetical protein IJH77_03430 [Mogibacterium sp.]|nr:hypothetical protein [Mogibacterium sp.]